MILELDGLRQAVTAMTSLTSRVNDHQLMAALDPVMQNGLKAGVIQHFEFTYELCWKLMKRWLEYNLGATYVDGVTRQELFRYAAEHQLIAEVELWMDFYRARNLTSHTYNANTAEEVFKVAVVFVPAATSLLQQLEAHNA